MRLSRKCVLSIASIVVIKTNVLNVQNEIHTRVNRAQCVIRTKINNETADGVLTCMRIKVRS